MNLREIYQLAIASSFLWIKIILVQSFKQIGCHHNSTLGLITAYCLIDYNASDPYWERNCPLIPDNLPVTLQVIYIRPSEKRFQNAVVLWPNTFKQYSQLQRIIHQESIQINLTTSDSSREEMAKNFTKIFSNLNSLEYLEISNSSYEDWLVVHLPTQLKSLNFDDNNYNKLDVHWAQDLEEISVQRNRLENIPKLATLPSPPVLKILRMNGNPLNIMTIVDIAPLCNLKILELDFPNTSIYAEKSGYCKCTMLKKWANLTNLRGLENVTCFNVSKKIHCPDQIWEDAENLRNECPLLEKSETTDKIVKAMKYAVMLIILVLVLAGVMLYLIRYFYLRDHWAAIKRLSTSIKMEEDEEEMDSEGNESSSVPKE